MIQSRIISIKFTPRIYSEMLPHKDVLCLAAGGGQQSAVFGLLGARVTVIDFTQGQLDGDITAAKHYGYPVETICAQHPRFVRRLKMLHTTSSIKDLP